jgi:hypothetical protein
MLQTQANALDAGIGTNWVEVPESAMTNGFNVPDALKIPA